LLLADETSSSDIAVKLNVHRMSVSHWRAGERKPDGDKRRTLEALYSIPVQSWDNAPHVIANVVRPVPAPDAPEPASAPPPAPEPDPVHEPAPARPRPPAPAQVPKMLDPIAAADALIFECNKGMKLGGLTSAEQADWQDRLLKAITMRQKLVDSADAREDKVVRYNPTWHALRALIVDTLVPYPDASRAVCDALKAWDERR